ncbi:MAG: benzoyl-CoA reductase, bzd-type, subunit O [Thermodesulfobacteriota bacterium]|nr:benzoyl-CoA reductase, bzd-type, subunit O [Thermodesulfobacteriota bacterium]
MRELKLYPTEPLKCWNKAKELRYKYYKDFVDAKDRGGLRWSGSAWAFHAIPCGLGTDVYSLTGEPYGATVTFFSDFSSRCLEEAETTGVARDLCAYLRNYWGGIILDKFILPDGTIMDEWPRADFLFTSHVCCSHAKWYQRAGELEGGVPSFAIDISVGPYPDREDREAALKYVTEQLLESIEWMEKVTGRDYDDTLLIEAITNECRSLTLWADICSYNQSIPVPMDEKTMFSLYVFTTLHPQRREVVDFYQELRDEIKDRVERGIAAAANERFRVATDSQPPWSALQIFRYMQKEYGVVSVGSWYTFGLAGAWGEEADGTFVPLKTPQEQGLTLKTREEALRAYADLKLRNWGWGTFQSLDRRLRMTDQLIKQWKVDAIVSHLNSGCEGSAMAQLEGRMALMKKGFPVVTFEGNMGDPRDFNLTRAISQIDSFMESLRLDRLPM